MTAGQWSGDIEEALDLMATDLAERWTGLLARVDDLELSGDSPGVGIFKMSSRAERRSALRIQVIDRSGGQCEWSACNMVGAHMAHIRGIGSGGDPQGVRDQLSNVAFLCVEHHDILDGRNTRMRLREMENLLIELVKLRAG